jgi:RNA 2',3'-cyclic 3'-phosphodiesterase
VTAPPEGEPQRLRLFVAVSIPSEVLDAVETVVDPIRERVSSARWAPVSNQHLTLKFLGHVDRSLVDEISVLCRTVGGEVPAGEIAIGGFGAFPNSRRARVLWAGVEDPQEVLSSLARGLDDALEPLGFEREQRAFTPHLTLARLRTPQRVGEILEELSLPPLPVSVDAFQLFRSRLSPKGARYEVLDTCLLGGGSNNGRREILEQ